MQEQYKNNMVSKEKDEWQLGQRPTVRDFKSEIKSKRIAEGVRRVSIRDLENDKMHENEKNSI